ALPMVHDDAAGSSAGSQKWRFQSFRSVYSDLKRLWWPCGSVPADEEAPADNTEASAKWRCCPRRFQQTGEEETASHASPGPSPRPHGKSRGFFTTSNSFCSAPSTASAVGGDDLLPQPQFNPEEFLRHECQSDLVDRFLQDYRKLAAYEAATSASVRAEEGVLPREVTVQSFPSQSPSRSESGMLHRFQSVEVSADDGEEPESPSTFVQGQATEHTASVSEEAAEATVMEASPSPVSRMDEGNSVASLRTPRAEASAEPEVPAESNPERTTSLPVQSDESPRTASKEPLSDSSQSPELSQPKANRGSASKPSSLRMKSEPLRPLLEVEEQGSGALISPVTISTIQSIPSPKAKQKHLVFMVDGEELQILGVDTRESNVPPEESPSRNRPAAGAGPLPPPEEMPRESGTAHESDCEKDVVIPVEERAQDDDTRLHPTTKRCSPPEKHCVEDSLPDPRCRHLIQGDEEALAALEVASWPPSKMRVVKDPDPVHDGSSPTYQDVTPLPSPPAAPATPLAVTPLPAPVTPITPITPVTAASPGPSRSRIAGAAAAAARAAAGARQAMAVASRVSTATGGAALATLVSPEVSGGTDRRNSVFSGRFMPLSLWAQAESEGATPPVSGPGSPDQAKDDEYKIGDVEAMDKPDAGAIVAFPHVLAAQSDMIAGEMALETMRIPWAVPWAMPGSMSAQIGDQARGLQVFAADPTDGPCGTESICKGRVGGELNFLPNHACDQLEMDALMTLWAHAEFSFTKDTSAEVMNVERGRLVSGSTESSPQIKKEWTSPYSPCTPVRGRGSAPSSATPCSPLSPSSVSESNGHDQSPVRFDVPKVTQSLSQSSYPTCTRTHTEVADETEVLEDILMPAPFADHEERVSTVPSTATEKQEAWRELPWTSEVRQDARAPREGAEESRHAKVEPGVPCSGNETSSHVSMMQQSQVAADDEAHVELSVAVVPPKSGLEEDRCPRHDAFGEHDVGPSIVEVACQEDLPGPNPSFEDNLADEAAASTASTCVAAEGGKPRCTARDDKLELAPPTQEPGRKDSEWLPEEVQADKDFRCYFLKALIWLDAGNKHLVMTAGSVCSSDPDALSTTPGPLDDHDLDWPFARMCYEGPDAGKLYIHQRLRRQLPEMTLCCPSTYKDEVDCLRLQVGLDVEPAPLLHLVIFCVVPVVFCCAPCKAC
ncbi:unnamed protein product, partial [Symbiodinium necroappetens]